MMMMMMMVAPFGKSNLQRNFAPTTAPDFSCQEPTIELEAWTFLIASLRWEEPSHDYIYIAIYYHLPDLPDVHTFMFFDKI